MNRRRWVGLILMVAMLAIAGWYAWSPIAILYHKQGIAFADGRLRAISEAQLAGTSIDARNGSKWYARRAYHCDRLVALGYLFHASYDLNNRRSSSFRKHQDAILSGGMSIFPMNPDRYWSISAPDDHMVIDVYDLPEFKPKWDAFAHKMNDPEVADEYVD